MGNCCYSDVIVSFGRVNVAVSHSGKQVRAFDLDGETLPIDAVRAISHVAFDRHGFPTFTTSAVSVRFWRDQCTVLLMDAAPPEGLGADDLARIESVALEGHGGSNECPLCNERARDVAFACGHTVCARCAARILDAPCPYCAAPLSGARRLYL